MRTFRLGLQSGSMNNPARTGYTNRLLNGAGFSTRGYVPGEEKTDVYFDNAAMISPSEPMLEGHVVESQRAPELLYDGEIDGLIAGFDWITEWQKRGKGNVRIMDLGFGGVDVVVGIKEDVRTGNLGFYEYALGQRDDNKPLADQPLVCHTEFPCIAKDDIMENDAYKTRFGEAPPVMISTMGGRITNGISNDRVVIKHVIGQTEAELGRGADYIVECRQSGRSFEEAGVKAAHLILKSQAGLYTSPKTLADPDLSDFINYLAWMFKNSTLRENPRDMRERMLVKANVRCDKLDDVSRYIRGNNFCDKAPTVEPLKELGAAVEIDIPISRWPEFTYGIWRLRKRLGEDAITDILRIPIEQMLE